MNIFNWIIVILLSLVGAVYFIGSFTLATSAIQQAAAGACGMAFAVIPYVIARACQEIRK